MIQWLHISCYCRVVMTDQQMGVNKYDNRESAAILHGTQSSN